MMRSLQILLIFLILSGTLGLSRPLAGEPVTFGFVAGQGDVRNDADAQAFAVRLARELDGPVKAQLFETEDELRQWMSRYREVDCGWFGNAFLEGLPKGELLPLIPEGDKPKTQASGQFVVNQGVGDNLARRLRNALQDVTSQPLATVRLPSERPVRPDRNEIAPEQEKATPSEQTVDRGDNSSIALEVSAGRVSGQGVQAGASLSIENSTRQKTPLTAESLQPSALAKTTTKSRELNVHPDHSTGLVLATAQGPSASIPLDSWVYPAIDKLVGLGLIDSILSGSRPFSRTEASRLVREACDRIRSLETPLPVALELLARLEEELQSYPGESAVASSTSYFKPVRELRLDYLNQKGHAIPIPGTSASQFPLNYNNFGIDYGQGDSFQLTLETEARLGRYLLLNWRPYYLANEEDDVFRTQHATATFGLGPFNVSVGRDSLWWGQGRHGSLVLTNNAKPLDMVRLTNPTPLLLPWVFEYLGPFRFDAFWSRLDDYVANADTGRGDDPYFAGMRLNFKPLPWLEIGASRAVIFGGDDIDVGTSDFLTILGGKNLEGEDTSNSVAAVDARLRLPFLWGAEVYGEMGGEDEAGGWISNRAWLAGLYLPRLEPTGRLSLRLEHADLSHIDSNSPPWYRHGTFRSGYIHDGKILGHHVGGAATDTYGELEILLPHDLTLTLSLNREERGTDQPFVEKHLQTGLSLNWRASDWLLLSGDYAVDRVKNAGYLSGEEKTDHFARVAISGLW